MEEDCLKNIILWEDLDEEIKDQIILKNPGGNPIYLWKNMILSYHQKHRVRWQGNQHLDFYKDLLRDMRMKMELYPYHLCRSLTMNGCSGPFDYYIEMLCDALRTQKQYEEIPSFTAADILRLTGIQRTNYIETLQKCKDRGWAAKISKAIRGLLPTAPLSISVEHWWSVFPILSNNRGINIRRSASRDELTNLQELYTTFATKGFSNAFLFDKNSLDGLYKSGIIEYDIFIEENDQFDEPPDNVKNFNTNIGNSYFENAIMSVLKLLKPEVSPKLISKECGIPIEIIIDAISILCRLGLIKKITEKNINEWNSSWKLNLNDEDDLLSSAFSSPQHSLDTWKSEIDDPIHVTLIVGGEICGLICEISKEPLEDSINNGISYEKLDLLSIELEKSHDPRLQSLKKVIEIFASRNLEIRGGSQNTRCGLILAQGGMEPVIFTELPKAEAPIYRMFKLEHSKQSFPSVYYMRGNIVNFFPVGIKGCQSYMIFEEDQPPRVYSSSEALLVVNDILPQSSAFIVAINQKEDKIHRDIIKVPLPLNFCEIQNRALAEYLRDLNVTEHLEYAIGYLEIFKTSCTHNNSDLPHNCPKDFHFLTQSHGLPLDDPILCQKILQNINENEWFKYSHLESLLEAQQNEVFQFREFMCKIEMHRNLVYTDSSVKII
ncbi:unnamed protein product [Blepharisma stoltei]|uniref:Uncharacterized protein n=1 Tax=Blepharisma stoltei TaxID=1481888 RepID=A0AAU9JS58_9CILI|nr:unnamed protein product [Blepharisma stoltei]